METLRYHVTLLKTNERLESHHFTRTSKKNAVKFMCIVSFILPHNDRYATL